MSAPRILLVDDDEALRRLLRTTLDEGFEIAEAENGQRGLELLDSFRPDLLVLDWKMPGAWGSEVLDEVRRKRPDLPVVVLTAESKPQHRHLAEQLGADAFLTKPFSPLELLAAVERLLPGRPA
jgi:two-component system alkaline phosphatase synthesis response regulator PhoP